MKRRLQDGAGALLLAFAVLGSLGQSAVGRSEIVVYKSPTCGCCTKWESHLRAAGFALRSEQRTDMDAIKIAQGVPPSMRSCHTALVAGYILEGHVPAVDVHRLLKERPKILGLSVPGMPLGSPGMEGPRSEPYDVLVLRVDGVREVFSSYP